MVTAANASLTPEAKQRLYWPNIVYLVFTPIGASVLTPFYLYQSGFDWRIWVFTLVFAMCSTLSITGGYHRLFAHRSYTARAWVRFFFLLVGAGGFQGSALKWATDHRRHHRFVDTENDPYNIKRGFWYAHIGWLFVEDNPKFKGQFPADLLNERMVRIQDQYYIFFAFLMGFAFPTWIGYQLGSALGGFAVGGALRLVFTNHTTFFINSLCHMVGKQPYSDKHSARDSFIMAILAFGEGYHNFHHQFQSDYRNGVRWYHWDPTKWVVSLLASVGWAGELKRTSQPTIIKARLQMEEKFLIQNGVSAENLHPFKVRVEEAGKRLKTLRDDYALMKRDMQSRSKEKLRLVKIELKRTQAEFKTAWALWLAYSRHARVVARVAA